MKHSIKFRIAATFIIVTAAALAVIGVIHAFFLDDFYYANKKRVLVESMRMLDEGIVDASSDEFRSYCSVNSLEFALSDENLTELVTNSTDEAGMAARILGTILSFEEDNTIYLEESDTYKLMQVHDRFTGVEYYELFSVLSDRSYFLVLCPVQSIEEAAAISLRFYIFIGVAVIAASFLIIWLITRRLVRPIQELTEISERMRALDFTAKYTSGGLDEIGKLGRNFNSMSENLEQAITDLRSANEQLQADIREKEKIDEMRKEFISNVSHELKTPIALIQGYAEGLQDNVNEDPEGREFYCEVIVDEAAKMNRLVSQLLNLNQLEFGMEQAAMEPFDLSGLIRSVIASSKILLEQGGAHVVFRQEDECTEPVPAVYAETAHAGSAEPAPLMVLGDEFKIEQVITNYLTNAINHLDGERIIEISCRIREDKVVTTVFNTGAPVPEDELDKIWIKFYKVDKARTRAYGGSGIGLSIVKAIMDAHGEQCWAENRENGVAFSFTMKRC